MNAFGKIIVLVAVLVWLRCRVKRHKTQWLINSEKQGIMKPVGT